jgi:hypothetical protein
LSGFRVSVVANTFTNFGKSWALGNTRFWRRSDVPEPDLAANESGTSDRRHKGGRRSSCVIGCASRSREKTNPANGRKRPSWGPASGGACRFSSAPGECCRHDTTGKTPLRSSRSHAECPVLLIKINIFTQIGRRGLTAPSRPHEGRNAIVTIRGAGCDGRASAARRAVQRVRSSRVVLSPRRWGQVVQSDLRSDGG